MTADRLLVLGGTAEAARLAERTQQVFGDRLDIILSLAGRLPPPDKAPTVRLRSGGFGGADGLAAFLAQARIGLVIDATHPFAATISRHAAEACTAAAVPRLMVVRPPWQPTAGDRWIDAADGPDAAHRLPALGNRVFLATGPGAIAPFASLTETWFLVRAFAPPAEPLPLARHCLVVQRPPFTPEGEGALLRRHAIDVVVSKQSGGATDAKLAAARALSIPVIMIQRPSLPMGERVQTVGEAVLWLQRHLG